MKKKPTPKRYTPKQIRNKLEQLIEDCAYDVDNPIIDEFPGCCGMAVVYGLSEQTRVTQAVILLSAFCGAYGAAKNVSQVFFTDTINAHNPKWVEAKRFAICGPITRNPKTKNNIRVYIYTQTELSALIASFTASDLKELFDPYDDDDLDQ